MKKQNPKQVLPVQTRLTDTAESATRTGHSSHDMRKTSERSDNGWKYLDQDKERHYSQAEGREELFER